MSSEANEANHIKRDSPVMCVIGNPPYSGESQNKGEWIMSLMEDYKKEPGGKEKLKERNPKWINDDYVKFLRYGQHFIEKNGSGILAFINPHGFLDNPTFRGMRWHLLKTYDKIYTIDLHGNAKKKETAPDGSTDVNVFDIEQGVSMNIFVKTGKKKNNELGKVFHFDLFGKREMKYDFLIENSLKTISYKELPNVAPNYFFRFKDFGEQTEYDKGFLLNELFSEQSMGITTGNDSEFIDFQKDTILRKYGKQDLRKIDYRPFDTRYIHYEPKLLARARFQFMKHFFNSNLAISLVRRSRSDSFILPFLITGIADKCISSTLDNANIFPLYLYPETKDLFATQTRTPNLNPEILRQITEGVGLTFTNEKESTDGTFAPIDVLDYIYAVLHSPDYRETYKEFLKIDFPRVPYPKDATVFWQLATLGGALRQIHLLESPVVEKYITQYPIDGTNTVTKPVYQDGNVYINETQYFKNVPEVAWNFYIGGYQPAQKWLKDRRERVLEFEDILHYQKIIVALSETDRIMKEIDKISIV